MEKQSYTEESAPLTDISTEQLQHEYNCLVRWMQDDECGGWLRAMKHKRMYDIDREIARREAEGIAE